MNEKTAILNVRMLGDFSITYDGRQVSFQQMMGIIYLPFLHTILITQ